MEKTAPRAFRWPWGRKRTSTSKYTYSNIDPASDTEAKKFVLSKDFQSLFMWHLPALISCIISVVLLYLNFSEYIIGTEIGYDDQQTRNILATLQISAKAHEILIIASICNIARQWIQRSLIDDGTLLGLVGTENSISNVSLLASREIRATIGYCTSMLCRRGNEKMVQDAQRRGRKLLLLLCFLLIGCMLCSLSGPASAVLMIPQRAWFYEKEVSGSYFGQVERYLDAAQYPNILIDPLLGYDQNVSRPDIFTGATDYWQNIDYKMLLNQKQIHRYHQSIFKVLVNVTTSFDRPTDSDTTWKGSTRFTAPMMGSTHMTGNSLSEYETKSKSRGSETRFVADMTGIEAHTVCRTRHKQPCDHTSSTDSEWCYLDVNKESSADELQSSKSLLLVVDHESDESGENASMPRFWMTEGRRLANNERFTESIVFVFEGAETEPWLLVCSTSAILETMAITSSDKFFSHDAIDPHDYLAFYDDRNSSTIYKRPATLTYHEHWLDSIHERSLDTRISNASHSLRLNTTYRNRSEMVPTENQNLKQWARGVIRSKGSGWTYWWSQLSPAHSSSHLPVEAALAEVVVGGSYLSVLLIIEVSKSQYIDRIRSTFDLHQPSQIYPEDLMLVPIIDYINYVRPPTKVYHFIYGFRLSSRTGIFGVAILLTDILFMVLGSLWQCRKGGIIQSWGTTAEYMTLCLGSDLSLGELDNTCAGINKDQTLRKVVRVREVLQEHLGLVVVSPSAIALGSKINLEKKYGYLGRRRKRGNKKRVR